MLVSKCQVPTHTLRHRLIPLAPLCQALCHIYAHTLKTHTYLYTSAEAQACTYMRSSLYIHKLQAVTHICIPLRLDALH